MAQIIQDSVTSQHFMGTVLVERDGHAILDKGYGSADLEWKTPMRRTRNSGSAPMMGPGMMGPGIAEPV
jgi:hypothetical protein